MNIRRAETYSDFEWIRITRNSSRQFMTGDSQLVTLVDQAIFMCKAICSDLNLYICEVPVAANRNMRIGYLLLRKSSIMPLRFELTICIDKSFRNLGYGKKLLGWACSLSMPLVSSIYTENLQSIRIHQACGFVRRGQVDGAQKVLSYLYDPC